MKFRFLTALLSAAVIVASPGFAQDAPTDTSPPAVVDDSALRFFIARRDAPRIEAEIARLRALYPEWKAPEDKAAAAMEAVDLDMPAGSLDMAARTGDVRDLEVSSRAEAVRNFALSAYKAVLSFGPTTSPESLGENARYFSDIESYQTYRQSLEADGTLTTLSTLGATLSSEPVGEPEVSPTNAELTLWKTAFKVKETTADRKGLTDRCLSVEASVLAEGHPPLGDSYSFKSITTKPASASDCNITAATPIDKEAVRIEMLNRQSSFNGFLQSASTSVFALDFTDEEQQLRRSTRFFASGEAFESYRKTVADMGIFSFLKHNQMISNGSYMGNLTYEKADQDKVWHTAFYVKQMFIEPGYELSRCVGVAADVRELPEQFGGAEYAIEGISFHPMQEDSACESGKELTAAMWNLINTARETATTGTEKED